MKVSACTFRNYTKDNPYFSSEKSEKERPSQINKDFQGDKNKKTAEHHKLAAYSAIGGASIIALAGGAYQIYTHRSPSYVLKHLKPNKFTDSLPDFLKLELAKGNKFKKTEDFIKMHDPKYIIGKGANSTVYEIPFLDNYVMKIIKPDSHLDLSKHYIGLFPNDVNLGQAVWQHPENPRILLLKKIKGEPYSMKNWTSTIWNNVIKAPLNVTQKQADLYYSQISRISKMDQSVFDTLAHQMKVLDTTTKFDGDNFVGFKTDCINPNNLMVDFKNNTINIIDYFGKENEHHKNSHLDITAIMTDFTLLPEYRDLLKPNQQKELVNIIKRINDKAFKAAEKEGLSTNKNDFLEFIGEVHNCPNFRPPSVKKSDGGEYVRLYPDRANELISIIES